MEKISDWSTDLRLKLSGIQSTKVIAYYGKKLSLGNVNIRVDLYQELFIENVAVRNRKKLELKNKIPKYGQKRDPEFLGDLRRLTKFPAEGLKIQFAPQ